MQSSTTSYGSSGSVGSYGPGVRGSITCSSATPNRCLLESNSEAFLADHELDGATSRMSDHRFMLTDLEIDGPGGSSTCSQWSRASSGSGYIIAGDRAFVTFGPEDAWDLPAATLRES